MLPVLRMLVVTVAVVVLPACTAPVALTDEQLAKNGKAYMDGLSAVSRQSDQSISLERAVALALQNNLEFQMRSLEAAIASGNRKLTGISMLPSLTAQAGYRSRNNVLASVSRSVDTGNISLIPSTSSDQRSHNESLVLGWNMLDFGLQYFRAKQYGEQELIATEERRRAMQVIAKDVAYYWWMAKGFDDIQPDVDAVRGDIEQALRNASALASAKFNNPADYLDYSKSLYLTLKRMDRLMLDMSQARLELAKLMGMPAGVPITLTADDGLMLPAMPEARLAQWQMAALIFRPEIRQAEYRIRINQHERRAFWWGLLPSLSFGYGTYHDSNSYLVNNNWNEFGAQLGWNMIKLAGVPAGYHMQKASRELAETQARMQATTVVSQVAIALSSLKSATHFSCVSASLADVDSRRLSIMNARAGAAVLDRLSLIRAKVDNLLLRAEYATDRAELQRSRATVLASIGIGLVPDDLDGKDSYEVASRLEGWWKTGLSEQLKVVIRDAGTEGDSSPLVSIPGQEESELCL
ncbi:MAG: TolC family protein [Pedobacter sp.]|nr:TolC family protein [Pedobacter sp.]